MRNIYFFLLLLFSCNSFATDYYWNYTGGPASGFPSPSPACDSKVASIGWSQPKATMVDFTTYRCEGVHPSYPNQFMEAARIYRYGSACPANTIYNSATGICDPKATNPCESLAGTSSPYSKSGSVNDGFFFISGSVSGTANSGCQGSCEGTISGAKCLVLAGEPGTYTCSGAIYFTGQQCSSSSGGDVGASDSTSPPPATPTESTTSNCASWVATADGQSQTCVTTDTKTVPGTAAVPGAPAPSPSKSVDDKTTVTDKTTNPDGSSSTSITITTNNTYCTVGSCTTTTTTNTTSTHADPTGAVTSTNSTCTGTNCTKPTDNTGNGSGTDQGESISVTGGGSGTLVAKEKGSFDSANAHFDKLVADSKQELRDKLAAMKAAVTAKTSPTLSSGDGALPCEPVTFGNGYQFDLCLTSYEASLIDLRLVILFLAALIAFYIVFIKG